MRTFVIVISLVLAFSCASKTRGDYPNNGSVTYLDMTAGNPGGVLDTTGVTMHYKGSFKDNIEDLGVVDAKVSGPGKKEADVLKELQKEAIRLKADGVYQVEFTKNGDTLKADGYAFRFKQ
jgi:hypothetical protein